MTGYVHNLADGSVELVVEGEGGQVSAMLDELARKMRQYIRNARVETGAFTGEFREFAIRH